MTFEFDLNEQSLRSVLDSLRTAVSDALKEDDLQYLAEMGIAMIKLRTQRGNYLPGSKSPAQYSDGHRRVRERLGLPTNRVTLFMGKIGVLEGIKEKTFSKSDEVGFEIGYLQSTEAQARRIGGYLDSEGVGVNKIRYRHIGFTDGERDRLLKATKERVIDNISNA